MYCGWSQREHVSRADVGGATANAGFTVATEVAHTLNGLSLNLCFLPVALFFSFFLSKAQT